MRHLTVIDAPSNLGLSPTGVEQLPVALKSAGLMTRLGARYAGRVVPPAYAAQRDPVTHVRNGDSLHGYSQQLAEKIAPIVQAGDFPIVLGGDCSILIGAMLGLRQAGRYGLFFVDGHADFYQPEAELYGEVASMELAIVTGRGPDLLTDIDGRKPYVRNEDVVVFGYRDHEEQAREGSQDIRDTSIRSYDLDQTRRPAFNDAARQAAAYLDRPDLDGFWIHLDADVLDDAIMPAVDYRIPGGLQFVELATLLRLLLATNRAVGMTITIFNPLLDDDGSIAQNFVQSVIDGFGGP